MWLTGEILETEKKKDSVELRIRVPAFAWQEIKKISCKTASFRLNDGRYITDQQRKKIYATLKDISEYTGYLPEQAKETMKYYYIWLTGEEYFSLSSCSVTLARNFLNTLLDFCLEHGVQMNEMLYDRTDDIDHALWSCLKYHKCAICGRAGETHHWDAIGMGNDRTSVDDRWHRKICLCRTHHTIAHALGSRRFADQYHVYGIYYNSEGKEEFDDETEQYRQWSTSGDV
jgi:hypothetical protein